MCNSGQYLRQQLYVWYVVASGHHVIGDLTPAESACKIDICTGSAWLLWPVLQTMTPVVHDLYKLGSWTLPLYQHMENFHLASYPLHNAGTHCSCFQLWLQSDCYIVNVVVLVQGTCLHGRLPSQSSLTTAICVFGHLWDGPQVFIVKHVYFFGIHGKWKWSQLTWGLHHLLSKFELIFVADITFPPFLLCRYFWYQLVAYCVCFKMICEMSL